MDHIDRDVESVNEWEERQNRQQSGSGAIANQNKVQIGKVEEFFSKINVAALTLTDNLKVGDIIEIGNEEEAIRQRVSSMQIDKEDITEASNGESVGIKLKYHVQIGDSVYKINRV